MPSELRLYTGAGGYAERIVFGGMEWRVESGVPEVGDLAWTLVRVIEQLTSQDEQAKLWVEVSRGHPLDTVAYAFVNHWEQLVGVLANNPQLTKEALEKSLDYRRADAVVRDRYRSQAADTVYNRLYGCLTTLQVLGRA